MHDLPNARHEEASGTKYVPKEMFDEWKEKDPIKNYEEFLLDEEVLMTMNRLQK